MEKQNKGKKQFTVIVEKFLLPNHLTSWYLSKHIASGTSQSPLCWHVGRLPARLCKKRFVFPPSSAFGHLRSVRLAFCGQLGLPSACLFARARCLGGTCTVAVTDARHWGISWALALWKPSGDASPTQSDRSERPRRLQVACESLNRCLHEYKHTHWERWRATHNLCLLCCHSSSCLLLCCP